MAEEHVHEEEIEDVEVPEVEEPQAPCEDAAAETDSTTAEQAEDATEAGPSKHDERVASFASLLAGLAAKGEEVVAALNAKAEAADSSFTEKTAATSERIDGFAKVMQERAEKAAEQFGRDLDVIAQALSGSDATGKDASASEEADEGSYEPQFTPRAQAFRERMQVGEDSTLLVTDPEFVERFANFAFGDVTADVDLPDRTRFICWLATLLGCQGIDEYRMLLPAALNMGVEPEAVKEIVYQASAYLGIGRVYPFLEATNEALLLAGVELPLKRQATTEPTEASRYEEGEKAQCEALGEQMKGYKDKGNPAYPHIAQWLVKHCFGDWYTRGGLTMAEREMITFCFLAAQGGCENQLRSHTAANVRCGNDRAFLIKVVSNNVPFIGYPRSLNAMAVVDEVTGAQE